MIANSCEIIWLDGYLKGIAAASAKKLSFGAVMVSLPDDNVMQSYVDYINAVEFPVGSTVQQPTLFLYRFRAVRDWQQFLEQKIVGACANNATDCYQVIAPAFDMLCEILPDFNSQDVFFADANFADLSGECLFFRLSENCYLVLTLMEQL